MKLTKRKKEMLGISMMISALSLAVTFVVLLCKKRSLLAALLAIAAAEGVAGALLLSETTCNDLFGRKGACEDGEKSPYLEKELFVGEEADIAHRNMRRVLCDEHGGVCVRDRKRARKEILRDEEATEADFQ